MLLVQLTDTHVVEVNDDELLVDNNARLERAVESINAESPAVDAVLMTGDLTNNGTDQEFHELLERLDRLHMPVLPLAGNHDNRPGVRAAFPHIPWSDTEHASWVIDYDELRIVGLDSTVPGKPGAEIDEERAEWLAEAIDASPGRTLLAMHHPPFMTGIEWMDASGFIGLERLAAVLAEHPVERIVAGHIHRPVQATVAGIPAQTAPSIVQHVDLDLEPGAPVSLILDPVGYLIHRITPGSWVTHTRYLDRSERIHPTWTL